MSSWGFNIREFRSGGECPYLLASKVTRGVNLSDKFLQTSMFCTNNSMTSLLNGMLNLYSESHNGEEAYFLGWAPQSADAVKSYSTRSLVALENVVAVCHTT